MEVRLQNVKAIIEKEISPDGRIYGLKEYMGLLAKVCIIEKAITKPEKKE
jgi:hypothetical protein